MPKPRAACRYCGTKLTVHQRAKKRHCDNVRCRRRDDVVRRRLRQMRRATQLRRLVDETLARRDESLRADGVEHPTAYTTLIVPSNLRVLDDNRQERRDRFAAHLDEIIPQAVAAATTPAATSTAPPPAEPALPPSVLPIVDQVCATCEGACCVRGEDNAYLKPETVRHFMDARPELSGDEVRAAYLQAVPNRVYDASCIFHGPTGCGLPSEMRSDTCNRFFCTQLESFIRDVGDRPPAHLFVASADVSASRVIRTCTIHDPQADPNPSSTDRPTAESDEPRVFVDIDAAVIP